MSISTQAFRQQEFRGKKDAHCMIPMEREQLQRLKKFAYERKFESMAHMIRTVMADYMEHEMKDGQ